MGFFADRAVGHGSGGKPFDDLFGRFHLFDGYRFLDLFEIKETPERSEFFCLFVDQVGVFPKLMVVTCAG